MNLPSELPLDGTIALENASSFSGANFVWTFTPAPSAVIGLNGAGALGVAAAVSATSQVPQLSLSSVPNLTLGTYVITVQAQSGGLSSKTASATVALVSIDLSAVKVYPNPWRMDKHVGKPITFNNLSANSTVKIFTVSGHEVKSLSSSSALMTWDLTNNSGDHVASGIYMYLITDTQGNKTRGKLAIIK